MVQIPDDKSQELVVAGGLREETGQEHWGFNVRKGRGDLLCPPTVQEAVAHFARQNT
jgi:hypothetical protein